MSHGELVELLIRFISEEWPNIEVMTADHSLTGNERPPPIDGYIPDVYARMKWGVPIVGEAKTSRDFDTGRSQKQILKFLQYAHEHNGIFCLAIPFSYYRSAVSRLRYLARAGSYDIQFYVVHEIGSRRLTCNSSS